MRVKPGQHAADRGLDQLGVVWLLDVVRAHALEHVAEQIELPVGVGLCRLGSGAGEHQMRLHREQRHRCSRRRAEEYE